MYKTSENCYQLHPVMLVGTGSDVGKSVLATALCRIFRQDGFHPAPFKAQNMALNSFATPDGLEIGRAQAVQAEAAGVACSTDMNPILLKPNSEHTTQVVLNGKPIGNRSAYDYFRHEGREELRVQVQQAFGRLSSRFNPIVMEGAGSVSELNLRDTDLVNMPMARYADADVILVADIDRGGVFASCYGSVMLQTEDDRRRIKGIIINKFRGDIRLFESGRRMIEDLCHVPVLGVVPMFNDIVIEDEDSVQLQSKLRSLQEGKVNIAVVLLRHMSNFTDFDVLEQNEQVTLFYTSNTRDIESADIIILPGTKATLDDLYELRRNGVAQSILRAHKDGKLIVGICGGFQILGLSVSDPDGVEGSIPMLPGLGLLPVSTVMTADKTTRQVEFNFDGVTCKGYEIHQGRTSVDKTSVKVPHDESSHVEGRHTESSPSECPVFDKPFIEENNCIGTYIHGFLDNPSVINYLLRGRTKEKVETTDVDAFKQEQYDKLAEHVRKYVDIPLIYKILRRE